MGLFYSDVIKVILFINVWTVLYVITRSLEGGIYISDYYIKYDNIHEVIKILPFYLFICLGYYAILSICYNVVFINDCEKEYNELLEDISNERKYVDSITKK